MAQAQKTQNDRAARFSRQLGHVYPRLAVASVRYQTLQRQRQRQDRAAQWLSPERRRPTRSNHEQVASPVRHPRPESAPSYKQWRLEQKWRRIANDYFTAEWHLEWFWEMYYDHDIVGSDPQDELPLMIEVLKTAQSYVVDAERTLALLWGDLEIEDKRDSGLRTTFIFCHKMIADCKEEVKYELCYAKNLMNMPAGR